ncbi:MAG: ThuA domain-containing protein [Planctomycetota bacterium]
MAGTKIANRSVMLAGLLLFLTGFICSCNEARQMGEGVQADEKIKAVVVTAGHGFEEEPFLAVFDSFANVDYVRAHQEDHSEVFEDTTGWDYDVIVLYNMTQEISEKRKANFLKLLDKGVGVVAMHHCIAAFQNWDEYPKIIGAKYYLKAAEEDGVLHPRGVPKHGLDIAVLVEDTRHPITRGMRGFIIHDEGYNKYSFESDNRVLLSTQHPDCQGPLCWVRRYGNAKVCYIQLGHDHKAYENAGFRKLVGRAINWCAAPGK